MTRKHFVMLAAALKAARPFGTSAEADSMRLQANDDARAIAHVLADSNPRFDKPRFLAAAGVPRD